LRGKDSLLPNIGVEEQPGVGKQQGDAIKSAEGGGSRVEQCAQFAIDFQSRNGRKWRRNKRPRGFADGADGQIMAGRSPLHGFKLKILPILFNFSAEIERKLSIDKTKLKFSVIFFNLMPEMERNPEI
jgi:hypothetical protein